MKQIYYFGVKGQQKPRICCRQVPPGSRKLPEVAGGSSACIPLHCSQGTPEIFPLQLWCARVIGSVGLKCWWHSISGRHWESVGYFSQSLLISECFIPCKFYNYSWELQLRKGGELGLVRPSQEVSCTFSAISFFRHLSKRNESLQQLYS